MKKIIYLCAMMLLCLNMMAQIDPYDGNWDTIVFDDFSTPNRFWYSWSFKSNDDLWRAVVLLMGKNFRYINLTIVISTTMTMSWNSLPNTTHPTGFLSTTTICLPGCILAMEVSAIPTMTAYSIFQEPLIMLKDIEIPRKAIFAMAFLR